MNHCKQCGRKGGCGCLYHTRELCKKCHSESLQQSLPADLKAEFEMHDKEVKTNQR